MMTKKYCTHIDERGFIIATHEFSDKQIAEFDGVLLVGVYPPAGVDIPVKAKWDGQQWVEGATQQEIDEHNASQLVEPQPSEIDILKNRLEATEQMLLQMMMEGMM